MSKGCVSMVQSVNNNINKPNYNAVKINIKNPEVNAGNATNTIVNNNGIYSAVNIEIDNPRVNTEPKVYNYPEAETPVTYNMLNPNQIQLPQGFYAYHETNVVIPKIEHEIEYNFNGGEIEDAEEVVESEENEIENTEEETEEVEVPAPNYTTVENEKTDVVEAKGVNEEKPLVAEVAPKRPEIIPGEEIKPDVDMHLVISNLMNENFDIQAQQMEEIARISLEDPAEAVPYIVSDVFLGLIDITKKDTTQLEAPSKEQIEARKKILANVIAAEISKQKDPNAPVKLPYEVTNQELALAEEISPMEQAERNKEYALYTIAILSKVYSDEVEKQTGNIVPVTDLPGTSAIVDSLRYSQNPTVKIAAIDALAHIARPEYKEELNALFAIAQKDERPEVAMASERAMQKINN